MERRHVIWGSAGEGGGRGARSQTLSGETTLKNERWTPKIGNCGNNAAQVLYIQVYMHMYAGTKPTGGPTVVLGWKYSYCSG